MKGSLCENTCADVSRLFIAESSVKSDEMPERMSHMQVHPGFTFSYLLRGALLQYRLYCSRFRIPAWTFEVNADCAMNDKWKMGMFSSGWKRLLEGISGAAGLRKFILALSIYTHHS
jgi:hypothetical protein